MALKNEKKTEEELVLELALYSVYNRGGQMYEKGKQYRFNKDTAISLLSERDHGRPIWQIYKPVKRVVRTEAPVDATKVEVTVVEPIPGEPQKRIDIGDDSEIADVLENVTV